MNALAPILASGRAPSLKAIGMTKIFGPLVALDDVTIDIPAGSIHALLGENGAGKSTLVKSIMGFYSADKGQVLLDGKEVVIKSPRDARANGIGMVYQQFTLVPCLTAAENLVISRADAPSIIDWRKEKKALAEFMEQMPFKVPLDAQVSSLSAGEKQKLEILKLLYLDQRFMILDEPTSVLTPGEADEMLGLLGDMAAKKEITVLMISHKFREVKAFCDGFTVLRRGKFTGSGDAQSATIAEMSQMMIGDTEVRERATRRVHNENREVLELAGLFAEDIEGANAISAINL
ncbi:MAG: transporter ATP-binding protein, partial [Devosia sp.]|nr:transporter ATP-binding protein [Devosia sp.]